ncbi:unnamed protein product [Paramecium pentaurelia]|uniref:ubiquitinyl hydrolase 1 n=1 Tax=Paramecium pentaurelia TaxID=43138 RepID=A0A8S1TBB3_9CILI|nr:unnamed protein product [Paramecium pentaurelia]
MGVTQSSQNDHLEKYLGQDFPDGEILIGFENPSNICYSNVILQALYYCKDFRNCILQHQNPINQNNLLDLTKLLFQSISKHKQKTGVISTKKMMNYIKTKNKIFDGKYHQDSHEFYMWFINECEELLKDKQNNWIRQIFQGQQLTQIECLNCHTISQREEMYCDLSLDLFPNYSLNTCLQQMSKEEQLNGQNQFFCDKCQSKQDAIKRLLLNTLPNVLVIHLKRFKYDERCGQMIKVSTKIPFSQQLRIKAQKQTKTYELTTIIIHLGQGILYGHYICITKIQGKWFKFDDDKISLFVDQDLHYVYGRSYPTQAQTCAYMLFYNAQ